VQILLPPPVTWAGLVLEKTRSRQKEAIHVLPDLNDANPKSAHTQVERGSAIAGWSDVGWVKGQTIRASGGVV
jgi:hypothetical protein